MVIKEEQGFAQGQRALAVSCAAGQACGPALPSQFPLLPCVGPCNLVVGLSLIVWWQSAVKCCAVQLARPVVARCGHRAPVTWLWVWAPVEPEFHQHYGVCGVVQCSPAAHLPWLPGLVSGHLQPSFGSRPQVNLSFVNTVWWQSSWRAVQQCGKAEQAH